MQDDLLWSMVPGFLSNCMSPVLDPLHMRYERRTIAPSGMHSSHIIAKDHRALLSQPHGHLPQTNICSAYSKACSAQRMGKPKETLTYPLYFATHSSAPMAWQMPRYDVFRI